MDIERYYAKHLNYNWSLSKVMGGNDAMLVINHIWDNINRATGQELLRERIIEDPILKKYTKEKMIQYLDDFKKVAWKNLNPFRFIVQQINLPPTLENIKKVEKVLPRLLKMYEKYFNVVHFQLHTNETRLGIHIIVENMNPEHTKVGNFNVKGELVKLNGFFEINELGEIININSKQLSKRLKEDPNFKSKYKQYGIETIKKIWEEGQEIMQQWCKEEGLEFIQEPVTNKGVKQKLDRIQNFREWKLFTEYGEVNDDTQKNIIEDKLKELEGKKNKEIEDLKKEYDKLKNKNKILEQEKSNEQKEKDKIKKDLENSVLENKKLENENLKKEKQINFYIDKDEEIKQLKNQLKERDELINNYKNTDERFETYRIGNDAKRLLNNQKLKGETTTEQLLNLIKQKNGWKEYASQLKQELDQKEDVYDVQNFKRNQNEK